jgi:hypothetical protein
MNETVGRSVRLFLVEGNPLGLVAAEIVNWTGHVLSGPRSGLSKFLARPELDRTGIYFLFGPDPEDPDTAMVYVGESDNVRKRLAQHNKDDTKGFWERTCVVTSKDQNITKAHARYLESRLIAIARDVGRATLSNTTEPPPIALPEADQSDMEFFIEQIRLVLPVLGFEFLRSRPKPSRSADLSKPGTAADAALAPVFQIISKKLGVEAQAQEIDGEFVVLAGSRAIGSWKQAPSAAHSYGKLREKLISQGKLVPTTNSDLVRFVEDTPFSSPSAASAVIYGRADNGRTSWRVKGSNITYADWQEQQVAKVASEIEASSVDSEDVIAAHAPHES